MATTTIYGFENFRFFVPNNNPFGHYVWFDTRHARDEAVLVLEAQAEAAGLEDPTFPRVKRRIRTEAQWEWLGGLQDRGFRLGDDSAGHSWEWEGRE